LNAPGGNVIVLEGSGDQVTIPQQASGQVVTITLQLCRDEEGSLKFIDVDLKRFGNCLRVTTDPTLEQALSPKARVDICSLLLLGEVPDLPGEHEHLITLHRQEGEVTQALPHAYGDVCGGLTSAPVPGLRGLAAAGWRWVRRNVVALVTPRPLYARAALLDVGELGGLTDGFSDFQLALPAMMEALDGSEGQACQIETPPDDRPGVCVTDAHGGPVDGAIVHFEVLEGGGDVTPVEVVSGAGGVPGVAQVDEWTFGDATTNRLRAFGVGIAAQNNFDGPVRPFMPAIEDEEGEPLSAAERETQSPVTLHTGEVEFTATACSEAHVVDGILCSGEWGESVASLLVNLPGGGTTPGELFISNDATNLYFAVRFQRSVVDPGNSAAFEFDSNDNSSLDEGDDGIILNPSSSVGFSDLVRSSAPPCPPTAGLCSLFDTQRGGTNDGAAAFRNDGTFTVYEFSHPLSSGDVLDFSRSAGQTLGLFLSIRLLVSGATFADTRFPAEGFYTITIGP
jgi:hypothetical protein